MRYFPLILSGQFTETINGIDMPAERTIVLGLYSSVQFANDALHDLEAIKYPDGWGTSATFVGGAVETDAAPKF